MSNSERSNSERSLGRLAEESTLAQSSTVRSPEERAVPCLTIAWHPDLSRVGERALLFELVAGRDVELSRLSPRFASSSHEPFPLGDRFLSRRPTLLRPGREPGGLCLVPSGPGLELDGEPLDRPASEAGSIEIDAARLDGGVTLLISGRVVLILHRVRETGPSSGPDFGLVGESCSMRRLRAEIQRVAGLDIPVLLRGATGTGKELVAEAIHRHGARCDGPFVTVNLAAIPSSLAAAELLGAAKGAYTGAAESKPGYFRLAAGGTLFLDEIGEVSTDIQVLLLRALETGEIQPVGGGKPVPSDARLVAATDADLEAAIDGGGFRAPLLHRLASYTIRLPRLAERRDDVGPLLLHFLRREMASLGRAARLEPAATKDARRPWLGAQTIARLARHHWPGNVRELRNVARHLAVAWSDRDEVPATALDNLLPPRDDPANDHPATAPRDGDTGEKARSDYKPPSEIGDEELLAALREYRFATRPTARALGISRTSLYALIERSTTLRKAADLQARELRRALEEHGGDLGAAALALEVSARGLGRRCAELEIEASYREAKTRK